MALFHKIVMDETRCGVEMYAFQRSIERYEY